VIDKKKEDRPPDTVGDVRRRLKKLGNPWSPPKQLSDGDPLPKPARGGQPVGSDQIKAVAPGSPAEFEAHLRKVPPINPFLIRRWRELGLPAPAEESERNISTVNDNPDWGVA